MRDTDGCKIKIIIVKHEQAAGYSHFLRTHLINLVPLWVDSLVDDLALEEFRPKSEDAVRV